MRLFVANGYEATTLEAIAEAAGISRRTFFHYFKSKDEIILATRRQIWPLFDGMREGLTDKAPLDAVRDCLVGNAKRLETKESILVDRLFMSTEALRARKQTYFIEQERVLYGMLRERWPAPGLHMPLRLLAMVAMGITRLALEAWRENEARRPLADYLREHFAALPRIAPIP